MRTSQVATKLSHHLRELQIRLFVSVIILALIGVVVYNFYEPILTLLRSPLDAPLYYSSPAGSFAFVMKICFMGSLAITIPILIYNLIMFVRPAFEKAISLRRVLLTTGSSAILALAGAAFGFFIIIPGSLHFFAGFQVDGLNALISADSYLGFVTNVIITFVLVFQLPLLIVFIDTIKPLPPKRLLGMNKWVIVGSLVISLLVPFAFDLTTSLMIAAPIIVLYNLSIVAVAAQHAHATRKIRIAQRVIRTYPALNSAIAPVSAMSLNDQLIKSFADELDQPHQPISALSPTMSPRRASMDILPRTSPPVAVTKLPFQPKQITLSTHVRIISDVAPRANRALTSQ
ncbi:MAG: Sec-independent protein translocase subunit TatC, sec-independent protein translocase protein TatC [Candidatus Saccharibacteria bacterium]|nr:Sec-independent protein translocase subunit TatC, sec-independent protein translocase protein TatC [Candidatus Saccharibacteria bacterium]